MKRLTWRRSVLLLLGILVPLGARGQTDSVTVVLDSTVFSAKRQTSVLIERSGGRTEVRMDALKRVPSVLGNADPLRFLATQPGVETGTELDAGIHIQGSESSHSLVSVGGVPIYGAKHLLGIFSVFNPSHYSSMTYSSQAVRNSRLGGEVNLDTPSVLPDCPGGDFTLGMISAQATIRIPLRKSSAFTLSGRKSYLDILYPKRITINTDPLNWGFSDWNMTFLSHPGKDDTVTADFYAGSDRLSFLSQANTLDIDMSWHNLAFSLRWKHRNLSQTVYRSSYWMDMGFKFDEIDSSVPSSIATIGYKADFQYGSWTFGADIAFHDVSPQYPWVKNTYNAFSGEKERQRALESAVSILYEKTFNLRFSGDFSLKGMHYLSPEGRSLWGACPQTTLMYKPCRNGRLEVSAGLQKQYLFQTGVTDLGFPCEFWFLAGRHSDPQSSLYGLLSYRQEFAEGMFSFKAEAYYRKLFHQVEYRGNILEFFSTSYDLDDAILLGRGRNYGVNVMLHKQSGKLTGWIGYAFGRSLRRFDNPYYQGEFPSSHERLHEVDAVLSWTAEKWDAGCSFVAATGTPFTAPESFYLLANRIICNYGKHNANRLSPYLRADVSFNYYFLRRANRSAGVNLSVYNVTGRRNELYYKLYVKNGAFAYRPFSLSLAFLPSVGVFYRF